MRLHDLHALAHERAHQRDHEYDHDRGGEHAHARTRCVRACCMHATARALRPMHLALACAHAHAYMYV